jgi:hypothetical protein
VFSARNEIAALITRSHRKIPRIAAVVAVAPAAFAATCGD